MGGNNLKVSWFGARSYRYVELLIDKTVDKVEPINLHKVWDLHLPEKFIERRGLDDGTPYKHKAYADAIDQGVDPETARLWRDSTYLDWALESLKGRQAAYDIGDGRWERTITRETSISPIAGCFRPGIGSPERSIARCPGPLPAKPRPKRRAWSERRLSELDKLPPRASLRRFRGDFVATSLIGTK